VAKRGAPTSLKRRVGVRAPRRTFVIFCEGAVTEPAYLQALQRLPEVRDVASVDIRIESQAAGCAPLSLVRLAVASRKQAKKEEGEIDEFWCVFDVEWPKNHPNLHEAVTLARTHGIKLAISNPCFELWLILHFRDTNSCMDTSVAQRERAKLDGQASKGLEGPSYMPKRTDAAIRAAALTKLHDGNGTTFPHDNPSSGMYLLLKALGACS